jgi:hypothetical protein
VLLNVVLADGDIPVMIKQSVSLLQVSDLLPNKFSEETLRVYCKNRQYLELAKQIFPAVCQELGLEPPKVNFNVFCLIHSGFVINEVL